MKRYNVRRSRESTPNWSEAELLTDFTLPWETRTPPHTAFRALHDEVWLHFRFECVDEDLVLPEAPTAKERAMLSDRVELFFAADSALACYYGLEMTPRGDVLDFKAAHYRQIDRSWCCPGLEIAGNIAGSEYSVTGRIPLASLREMGVLRGHEMLTGIFRAEFFHREDGSVHNGWMPWVNPGSAKPDFHVPEAFGVMVLEGKS
jgi:hypothetical protein